MKITKEDLEERGFKTNSGDRYHFSTGKQTIWVRLDKGDVYVEGYMEGIGVPNCKTIEDLNELIRLFS